MTDSEVIRPGDVVGTILEDHFSGERRGKLWSEKDIRERLINQDEFPDNWRDFCTNVDWKVFDDDGELLYEGWLLNDNHGVVQEYILAWCMGDVGATYILVKSNGEWTQEIV